MARPDPHSVTQEQEPRARHLVWKARVDFAATQLHAQAALHLAAPTVAATDFSLDTRGLTITQAVDQGGAPLPFTLHEPEGSLGAPLVLHLPAGTSVVELTYSTARDASALQWLSPAQTHGGVHPYLFSQCQAIHARSVVPLQDTPSRRLTYTAELTVPRGLTAVMAASSRGSAQGPDGATTFHFEMPQPIAPYLLAFAVGELASRELSPRSRVWCEPALVDAAAWEFSGVEQQLAAAEALYGPYDWERFDLLVMPPAFPYGGMENPRLTFLTPTLVTGDRSLIDVVAHELAHSWTGNLVTNANA